jgi:SAM-dependent methyltransferase
MLLYLRNRTDIFSDNLKVLHIAPEYSLSKILGPRPNLEYVSADLDSPLAMVKMDITNIQFEDNRFDVVLCSHVLEHIVDDQKAMRELFRVLKPGGWVLIQSPIDLTRDKTFEDFTIVSPDGREKAFGLSGHVRVYGRDYKDKLEAVGFTVKIDDYVTTLDIDIVRKCGLDAREDIYFCTKGESKTLGSQSTDQYN